jgi:aspartate racemase
MNVTDKPVLGILGGLGPIASVEFLRTIYEVASWTTEQEAPRVLLHSDPTFSERTQAFLSGNEGPILEQLIAALQDLANFGASRLVICCVTMHHLLPLIPPELREIVMSLIDCVFAEIAEQDTKCLLLCSTGARRLRIFESHRHWAELGHRFVLPSEEDQEMIHRGIIFGVKAKGNTGPLVTMLEALLAKYSVHGFIAGCTEIHVLASWIHAHPQLASRYRCIDPLTFAAHRFLQEFYHASEHSLCV